MIRSISESQQEVLDAIHRLHCKDGFDCDATFGAGSFWTGIERPRLCFDIEPRHDFVVQADATALPVLHGALRSIVFDPPFLTYVKNGRKHKNGAVAMTSRYGGYYTYSDLEDQYQHMISEAWRVLSDGGKLVFKCQDIIHNHKMHATHIRVAQMAEIEGFRLLDIFVLAAKSRMPGPQAGMQRHARVWHSYFMVFEKPRARAVRRSILRAMAA